MVDVFDELAAARATNARLWADIVAELAALTVSVERLDEWRGPMFMDDQE